MLNLFQHPYRANASKLFFHKLIIRGLLKTLNVILNLFQHLLKFRRLRVKPAMTRALQKGFLEVPISFSRSNGFAGLT